MFYSIQLDIQLLSYFYYYSTTALIMIIIVNSITGDSYSCYYVLQVILTMRLELIEYKVKMHLQVFHVMNIKYVTK